MKKCKFANGYTYNQIETLDRVYRSLGILQNCRMISMEEASYRLSEVKLELI